MSSHPPSSLYGLSFSSNFVSSSGFSWPREAAWSIISVVSSSVCQTITFESLIIESLFSLIRCISREYVSKFHRSSRQDQGHGSKNRRKSPFLQWKTWIGNNSASITLSAVKFACSIGFLDMADRMVWPTSLSHNREWPRVTKCTYSRVVGLR